MMLRAFLLLSFSCMALSPFALAADGEEQKMESLLESDRRFRLLCGQTLTHRPAEDVAYEPGKDAHGNPVLPADLEQDTRPYLYPLEIPITLDLIEKFDLNVPAAVILEPEIAGIQVHEDGRVDYNGHDVTGKVQDYCLHQIEEHKKIYDLRASGKEVSGEHH